MSQISDHDLPNNVHDLKKKLKQLSIKEKSLLEHVHDSNNKANTLLSSVNSVFSIVASALSGHKNIPLPMAGFIMSMVAVIPQSGAILTDPKKSIPEKIIAAGIIGVMSALAITAFVIGAAAGAIISSVIAGAGVIMEGLSLFGLSTQKYATAKAYQLRKEFDALIEQKIVPESAQYNELLEVRAVELQHQLTQPWLKSAEQKQLNDELGFIDNVLKNKSLTIGADSEGAAAQLIALYKEREDKMAELVMAATEVNSGNHTIAKNMTQIKDEVIALDTQIKEITAPKEHLKAKSSGLNSTLALTSTNLAISTAGFLFSILGVLLTVGVFAAPPLFVPAMIGVGITMSVIGLLKWGAEKYEQYQSEKLASTQLVQQENAVLNEALTHYAREQNPEPSQQLSQEQTQELSVPQEKTPEPKYSVPEEPVIEETSTLLSTNDYKEKLNEYRATANVKEAVHTEEIERSSCSIGR